MSPNKDLLHPELKRLIHSSQQLPGSWSRLSRVFVTTSSTYTIIHALIAPCLCLIPKLYQVCKNTSRIQSPRITIRHKYLFRCLDLLFPTLDPKQLPLPLPVFHWEFKTDRYYCFAKKTLLELVPPIGLDISKQAIVRLAKFSSWFVVWRHSCKPTRHWLYISSILCPGLLGTSNKNAQYKKAHSNDVFVSSRKVINAASVKSVGLCSPSFSTKRLQLQVSKKEMFLEDLESI